MSFHALFDPTVTGIDFNFILQVLSLNSMTLWHQDTSFCTNPFQSCLSTILWLLALLSNWSFCVITWKRFWQCQSIVADLTISSITDLWISRPVHGVLCKSLLHEPTRSLTVDMAKRYTQWCTLCHFWCFTTSLLISINDLPVFKRDNEWHFNELDRTSYRSTQAMQCFVSQWSIYSLVIH